MLRMTILVQETSFLGGRCVALGVVRHTLDTSSIVVTCVRFGMLPGECVLDGTQTRAGQGIGECEACGEQQQDRRQRSKQDTNTQNRRRGLDHLTWKQSSEAIQPDAGQDDTNTGSKLLSKRKDT